MAGTDNEQTSSTHNYPDKDTENEFLLLLNRHRGIVHRLARVYEPDAHARADLVQEMILQLWRAYNSFRSDSQFSTWMYRVCLNTALTFIRKEKSRGRIFLNEYVQGLPGEAPDHNNEQIEMLYNAIYTLSDADKGMIFLYLEGFSGAEIAVQLGISEVNVRVKLNRIRDKIRQKISI
jgi:RNA polymerase sigma-70 factor (ECF subfamily)